MSAPVGGPVLHQVVFQLRPDTTPVEVEQMAIALRAAVARLDGVRLYVCGPDLGLVEGNADFGAVGVFDDESAYRRYAQDLTHLEVIATLIAPRVLVRSAVQLAAPADAAQP